MAELGSIQQAVFTTEVDSSDDLFSTISKLDKGTFDAMLKLKKLLYPSKEIKSAGIQSDPIPTIHGVKLPKLDVPTFDGDILKWTPYWNSLQYPFMIVHISPTPRNLPTSGTPRRKVQPRATLRDKCKKCQRAHHTLIHDNSKESQVPSLSLQPRAPTTMSKPVASHTTVESNLPNTLLMT